MKTEKTEQTKKITAGKIIQLFAAMALIGWVTFSTMAKVEINSDFANHVLEGADWIGGNFFLKDWVLTGVSFLTTELPFYGLAASLLGIQPFTYVLAAGLILSVFLWLGFFMLRDRPGELTLADFLVYFAVAVVSTVTKAGHFRGHTAAFSYTLILFWLTARYLKADDRTRSFGTLIGIGLTLALGVTGDVLIAVIGALPILILSAWELIQSESPLRPEKLLRLAGVVLAGVLVGVGLDRLYFMIGGSIKNEILARKYILSFNQIGPHLNRFINGLVELANGSSDQTPLTFVHTLRWGFVVMTLAAVLIAVVETVVSYVRRRHEDFPALFLALAIAVMSGICVFTDMLVTPEFTRYFSFMIVFGAILIVRLMNRRRMYETPLTRLRIPLSRFLIAAALVLIALHLPPMTPGRSATRFDRVAEYLEANGYRHGFAHFWNASSVTVSSRNQVKVRAITVHRNADLVPEYAEEQRWFYQPKWFTEAPHTFILVDSLGYLDVSKPFLLEIFGEPLRVETFEDYEILIYDRDLTLELNGR